MAEEVRLGTRGLRRGGGADGNYRMAVRGGDKFPVLFSWTVETLSKSLNDRHF